MSPSLLLVSANPESFAAQHAVGRQIQWPQDAAELLATHWSQLAPMLDAVTGSTGVRRLGADEALALPMFAELAVALELGSADHQLSLITGAGNATRLLAMLSGLGYAEDRVAGVPLDLVAPLLPAAGRLPGLTQAASVLSLAREVLTGLRDPERWLAVTDGSETDQAAARVLSLAGMTVLEPGEASSPSPPAKRSLRETTDGFELRIPVRGIRKELLRLASAEGRLLVSTDGVTIPIELPAALKRCKVTGASTDADALLVRFQVDERRWRR